MLRRTSARLLPVLPGLLGFPERCVLQRCEGHRAARFYFDFWRHWTVGLISVCQLSLRLCPAHKPATCRRFCCSEFPGSRPSLRQTHAPWLVENSSCQAPCISMIHAPLPTEIAAGPRHVNQGSNPEHSKLHPYKGQGLADNASTMAIFLGGRGFLGEATRQRSATLQDRPMKRQTIQFLCRSFDPH